MKVADISPPPLGDLGVLLNADESPWNPRWFPYGSFPLYLLKGVQLVYELGTAEELSDLRISGRTISALADVATVMVVYLLGSRMYDRRTGLLASLLIALAVIHIQLSHFFAVDTLLALFTVAGVYFMYRVAMEGRLRDSVLAGTFVGLGLATKVSLGPLIATYVIAHLMYATSLSGGPSAAIAELSRRWRPAVKGVLIGAGASLLVLFIAEPYAFLDASRFFGDAAEQSEMVRRIRDYPYTRQYVDTTPYLYQVRQLATWGLGWPLGLLAWAGLASASLRGMRLRYGFPYLAIGLGLPIAVLLVSTGFVAIFLAVGVALTALMATLPIRSQDSRMDVLVLSWVVPSLLITGALEVKFLRYLLPITPFLLLFASRTFFALWDSAKRSDSTLGHALRPWLAASLVLVVGASAFYALSYLSIYREPHTAVRAAEWINRNVPEGSAILKEHWDEGLPNLQAFRYGTREMELQMYDPDTPGKVKLVAQRLAEADYLVLFSNRLYGTIPRLPERYPASSVYYSLLFSGQLGYDLVHSESTYPELLGLGFVDETFGRPGIAEPAAARPVRTSRLSLNLGFADESFSVYDHPKVLIFENVARRDAEGIMRTMEGATLYNIAVRAEPPARTVGLMLSQEDADAQQSGGTWTDIVRADSWTSRLPVVAWLIMVEGIALLTLPIAFVIFRPLPDRGYLFAKALGLLLVGLVVWLLASLQWMAFSQGSIAIALTLLTLTSLAVLARFHGDIRAFVKRQWRVLLIGEVLFLAAFFAFLLIRMANPDLWHEWRGGEKPMDFAYLNAVMKSTYMPPYDPWFGGGQMNYYYWGHFLVATLIRATGMDPGVAFNLAIPAFFALAAAAAFGLVYNLAEGTRRGLQQSSLGATAPPTAGGVQTAHTRSEAQGEPGRKIPWSPVVAGIGAALFVTVLGNLDGAIQVGQGAWRVVFQDSPFGEFDFWRSTRMMPSQSEGITEFPFFTFLFADLHAHLMELPFTLLALGSALSVLMGATGSTAPRPNWSIGEVARLAVLGLAVGSLMVLNAWDFPTYLMIGVAAVFLTEYFAHGGLGLEVVARAGVKSLFILAVGYLAFLPFHASNESFFNTLWATTHTTALWRFLAINGLFILVIGAFFFEQVKDLLVAGLRASFRTSSRVVRAVSDSDAIPSPSAGPSVGVGWITAIPLGALVAGFAATAVLSGVVGSTVPFVVILLVVVAVAALRWLPSARPDVPLLSFVAVIVVVALGLALGLEFFRVEEDIDRMNSIFKFYLQIWVLLALASAYILWRSWFDGRLRPAGMSPVRKVWLGALAVLLVSASIYPVLGTRARLGDRFQGQPTPLTLDGTAYIQDAVYRDREGDIDLDADFDGILWLRENVEGSPIVLEGVTPTYRWGSRVSNYTGLPTVVGWRWHQEQQRWDYRWAIADRIGDVERIYATTSATEALSLLRKYGVKYVYVGRLERLYYPGPGLDKFDGALSDHLKKVYQNPDVAIYRVLPQAL